jgi:ABC-2 type transport system permease protein
MQKGVIDRFRSLPMSQSAVLLGRTVSDILYNVLTIMVMSVTGLLVGWRIRTSLPEALAGFVLLLLVAYAFSWVMAYVGLLVRSPEVINNASFLVILPLTFIANAFVPIDNFPAALRIIAEWNPASQESGRRSRPATPRRYGADTRPGRCTRPPTYPPTQQ